MPTFVEAGQQEAAEEEAEHARHDGANVGQVAEYLVQTGTKLDREDCTVGDFSYTCMCIFNSLLLFLVP